MNGALSAGSIFVKYGADRDEASLRRFKSDMRDMAEEARRAGAKVEDRNPAQALKKETADLGTARRRFESANREMATSARRAGDAVGDGYARGANRAERELRGLERAAKRTGRGLSGYMKAGLASMGILGVASAVKTLVKAGISAEVSGAQFDAQLRASGVTAEKTKEQITDLIGKQAKMSGFMRGNLRRSFLMALRTTGDWRKAIAFNNTAMDVARARGMGLEQVQQMLSRAYITGGASLRRFGIDAVKVTTAQDATKRKWDELKASVGSLSAAQKAQMKVEMDAAKVRDKEASATATITKVNQQYAGQAKAYGNTAAGSIAKFQVAWASLLATIGKNILPVVTPVMNRLTAGVEKLTDMAKNGTGPLGKFFQAIGDLLKGGGDAGQQIGEAMSAAVETALIDGVPRMAKTFWSAFWHSGWLTKAVILTILIKKFKPLFGALGGALGMATGRGGLAGLAGGVVSKANPVPVIVMNQMPGGVGGPAGKVGKLGKLGKVLGAGAMIPGLGTVGGGGLAGLGLPALGIAAVLAGGAALATKISGQGPLGKTLRPGAKGPGYAMGQAAQFNRGKEFIGDLKLDPGSAKQQAKQLHDKVREELKKVPESFRQDWAKGAIRMATEMRAKGQLPAGAARRLAGELSGTFKVISPAAALAAMRTANAMARIPQSVRDAKAKATNPLVNMGLALKRPGDKAKEGADKTERAMWRTKDSVQRAKTPIGDALRSIGDAFKTAWGNVKSFWGGIGSTIKSAGGKFIRAVLPGMATGGRIVGPKGAGIPIMAHADEVVLNRTQQEMVGPEAISAALQATNAPVLSVGGSYAGGGSGAASPARRRRGRRLDPNPTTPGRQRFDDNLLPLILGLTRAEGTTTTADDTRYLRLLVAAYGRRGEAVGRLLRNPKNSRKRWPGMWRALMSEQAEIAGALNDYRARLKDLGQAPEQLAMAVTAARTDLYSQFGSNFRPVAHGPIHTLNGPTAPAKSTTVNNYFQQPPPDPHAFSRSLAFELKGAM